MNSTPLLAHPKQRLSDHLSAVAELAEAKAACFGASSQSKLAGLLHDLGKAEDAFQTRMNTISSGKADPGGKQPHARHGAALALAQDHWPVAFSVNGHHSGLHNRDDLAKQADYVQHARECLDKLEGDGFREVPKEFGRILPESLERLAENPQEQMLAVELFTRFLFSALIDADRLDTEQNDPEAQRAVLGRNAWRPFAAAELLEQVSTFIQGKRHDPALLTGQQRQVQLVRDEVAAFCRSAANQPRGLFSLTVPTGGGKTLASTLFALSHAQAHSRIEPSQDGALRKPLRRVIVVIPYLSIIQQTAFELRKVFADWVQKDGVWVENDDPNHRRTVLEHHSGAADPAPDEKKSNRAKEGDYSRIRSLRQLATENWDAPIIVTTSVQFFDSLFSRRPADARKLHSISQSIIVFDEVQSFPPHLLPPILHALGELTNPDRPYGCSALFCTATQPALSYDADEFPIGLKDIRAIVPPEAASKHFRDLKRVRYCGLDRGSEPETLAAEELAERATANERKQCLVVVNTRKSARQVFDAVWKTAATMGSPDAVFHLSTWMTPIHRLQVLEEVRRRLSVGEACFLVSTQCIEAGVDVDFPEVWRAYGPYDSIVQAAGRCNREGKLNGLGRVHVFRLQGDEPKDPPGVYSTATAQTTLLRRMGRALPEDPTSFGDYFRLLYQISVPDECLIQRNRAEFRFEEVSKLFEFIEDKTFPVLVREYVENGEQRSTRSFALFERAQARGFFTRDDWRTFQRDIVTLPLYNQSDLVEQRLIEDCFDHERHLFLLIGDGAYRGGLSGFGVNFKPDYSERTIL